jgi:hypothetical protein
MDKPIPRESLPTYNLLEILDYIEKLVPNFKDKVWQKLYDMGYIHNDTTTGIYWEGLIGENTSDVIVDGINVLFNDFPDIKEGKVQFEISW